jgi:hypothetical protein
MDRGRYYQIAGAVAQTLSTLDVRGEEAAMTYEFDLQRLRQLIGREPTICPKDIHKFVEFLLQHKEQGIDPADIYRQIELTTMSLDELEQLSPQEYDEAMACRVAARNPGFLKVD